MLIEPRKRGRRSKFDFEPTRSELVELLKDPLKTYQDAADHFDCSPSTIHAAIQRINEEAQQQPKAS